ncbi:DNA-binding transcriptional regulator, AcrR family [Nakamurella panacisegetis]|uniref:DNA-binding transcriptional regulator, AcrR family n=1 Tax=Nakamurella panacisegetis TaxID=1090615 RepID=A0A1H0LDV6_9ACTN|nr:TetR/AcrR family transcriptional regulator [Nakamurella panacisegetis]SDO66282.1 DNA-binding transcriptional regulator, AcrR family [Nakamurella panacisegetis]
MEAVARTENRADSRARIIAAAARLLREQGPAAVTTRGVAQAAGVQAPVIYRLFGDKDGLLDAVAEQVMETYVAAKTAIVQAAAAADADPVDDLRAGWSTQIEFGVANPTLFALLSNPGREPRSPAAQAGEDILRSRIRRIAAAGRMRVSEQRAVDLIRAAGTGAVLTLLSAPPDQRDPGLADALFDAVLRDILTDAPPPPDSGPMAAAVAFRTHVAGLDMLSQTERQLLSEWLDRAIKGL